MNLEQTATKLKEAKESIILLYAFNATGKTRLSVAYKDVSKRDGEHVGVYYNAFSEDLFTWDNDHDNGEQSIKLDIKPSSLNRYHSLFTEDAVRDKLIPYKPKYYFEFVAPTQEKGIDSILFFESVAKEKPIKISRGEERIFVWCFFLALFEVEGWADKQGEHFFIDDPVSSLDDQNIFITAWTVIDLIERHLGKRKIIITSHHFGFVSILDDWINRGDHKDKFKKQCQTGILQRADNEIVISNPRSSVLLYHLRLLQILDEAYQKKEVFNHHFVVLRQVLENIASFLGKGQFSYVLNQIGIRDEGRIAFIINSLSHERIYTYKNDTPVEGTVEMFMEVFGALMNHYKFAI